MICGDIMTMPGLPKVPSAEKIDMDEEGNVVGLFLWRLLPIVDRFGKTLDS